MLNDPAPDKRPHPLEQSPAAPEPPAQENVPPETPPPEAAPDAPPDAPPQPPARRPHPLEVGSASRLGSAGQAARPPRQQIQLHIPTVRPIVTYMLLAVNIVVFMVGWFSPRFNNQLLDWGAADAVRVLRYAEYHRLFTAMFLHANLPHLFFNMYALYIVGLFLEPFIGYARFALIYFLGGLAGSVASVVLSQSVSVGASGAIFAILGAEYVFLYQHRKLLGEAGRVRRQSLLFIGVVNLAFGVLTNVTNAEVQIDNWGHIGGLVGGVALAWFISPFFVLRRHPQYADHFISEDVNPLNRRYWIVSLYIAALLAVLIAGVYLIR